LADAGTEWLILSRCAKGHFYHTALGLQATANRGGLDVVFIRGGEGGKCESWEQIVSVVRGNWQYNSVVDYIPG
jgi:hypothetical protein